MEKPGGGSCDGISSIPGDSDRVFGGETMRRMIQACPLAVFIVKDGRYAYANPAGIEALGYRRLSEVVGMPIDRTVKPDDEPAVRRRLEAALAGGANPAVRLQILRPDGEKRLFESRSVHIEVDGEPAALVMGEDVSAQAAEEERSALDRRRLEAVTRLAQSEMADLAEILDFALETALSLTASRVGYVYHYDEDLQTFTLYSWSNEAMERCSIVEKQTVYELAKTGIWGEVVRTRRPIIVNDFCAPDPRKKGYPEGHVELSRFMSIPVFISGRIVAVVGVGDKPEPYTESDADQLVTLMDSVWKLYELRRLERERHDAEKRRIEEKDLLIREVHHRIKNNMGLIAGMLSIQAGMLDDAMAASALGEMKSRVEGMMILYDKLYRSEDFVTQSARAYLGDLLSRLAAEFGLARRLIVELDDVVLDTKVLFPLGLIANELCTNALKYAFPGDRPGTVSVRLAGLDARGEPAGDGPPERLELSVADDGVGLGPLTRPASAGGFGYLLIEALCAQLKGELAIDSTVGTRVTLTCPARPS